MIAQSSKETILFLGISFGFFYAVVGLEEVEANIFHVASTSCYTCHLSPFAQKFEKATISSSEACLRCHDGSHTDAPDVLHAQETSLLPGGTFLYVATGNPQNGHNLSGSGMACVSCHDPHGSKNTSFEFRLLKKTIAHKNVSTSILSTYADEQKLRQNGIQLNTTGSNHNVYRGNFAQWCGACHEQMASQEAPSPTHGWQQHPANTRLGSSIAYYGSTYDPAFPLEKAGAGAGVSAQDKVFCLSCHYAHGGPYRHALRWDYTQSFAEHQGCRRCHH